MVGRSSRGAKSGRSASGSAAAGTVRARAAGVGALVLTGVLLSIVQRVVSPPALLLERFVAGGGWLTAVVLSLWAGWLARTLVDPAQMRIWRPRIWLLFSIVFFAQLIVGLAGVDALLMTGKLHLPVPALIVAGPIYRGGGWFMLVLFLSTLVAVGPAWCSWLCYIGAWDDTLARRRRRSQPLPRWRRHVRLVLLVAVIAVAALLRGVGAGPATAAAAAAGFGLVGVGVMLVFSRRAGAMVHCTAYCPIGWLATRLGKLSPFRLRIDRGCTQCLACSRTCRFDALRLEDIERRRPGESCTLCGDCVASCDGANMGYRAGPLRPATARAVFVVLVCSLHAVFLGVARM